MLRIGRSSRGQPRRGLLQPVVVQVVVEVAVAQLLVDQGAQRGFTHPEVGGEGCHRQALAAVGVLLGHGQTQPLEGRAVLRRRLRFRCHGGWQFGGTICVGHHGRQSEDGVERPAGDEHGQRQRHDADASHVQCRQQQTHRTVAHGQLDDQGDRGVQADAQGDPAPGDATRFDQIVTPAAKHLPHRCGGEGHHGHGMHVRQRSGAGVHTAVQHGLEPRCIGEQTERDHAGASREIGPVPAESVVEQAAGRQPEPGRRAGAQRQRNPDQWSGHLHQQGRPLAEQVGHQREREDPQRGADGGPRPAAHQVCRMKQQNAAHRTAQQQVPQRNVCHGLESPVNAAREDAGARAVARPSFRLLPRRRL